MLVSKIIELDEVAEYLVLHKLTEQYRKATDYLLSGNSRSVDLKKRKPRKNEIWQFRITRKYRAYCYFSDDTLVVFEVSDHQ